MGLAGCRNAEDGDHRGDADGDAQCRQDDALWPDMRLALRPALNTSDPVLLERLVQNLAHNAVRHNVSDGWISVDTRVEDGEAVLVVVNTDPSVPAHKVVGLLEPFRRLDGDRMAAASSCG